MTHQRTLTAAHWGVYEVEYDDKGQATKLHPFSKDPDPSPIGLQWDPLESTCRHASLSIL